MNPSTIALLVALAVFALAVCLALYFQGRDLDSPPSRTERILAMVWLVFRRLVCGLGAVACVCGAVACVQAETYGPAIALLVFATFMAWTGLVGAGVKRGDMNEDPVIHDQRRKRYGWWL